MAVSHHANAVPSGNPTTGFTVVIPSTVATDDILILSVSNAGTLTDPVVTDDDTAGNTWAKLAGTSQGTENGTVWWKRATSATASKTITVSGCVDSAAGVLDVYRGCLATGNPYEGATAEANASADETHAAITPTVDGAMVCLSVLVGDNLTVTSPACTTPGALTIRGEKLSTGGGDSCAHNASALQTTAGTTGAFTWAMANATSISVAFALKPAAADRRGRFTWVELEASGETPNKAGADTGTSAEAVAQTVVVAATSDTGTSVESAAIAADRRARFTWVEVESVVLAPTVFTVPDSGAATDAGTVAAALVDTDAGSGSDSGLVAGDESKAGTDANGGPGTYPLRPDNLLAIVNVTGGLTDIDESPDSSDAAWLIANSVYVQTEAHVSFPTPTAPLVGTQKIRARVRRVGGSAPVTARIDIYEGGVLKQAGTPVSVSAGESVIEQTFDPSILADATGAGLEAKFVGIPA